MSSQKNTKLKPDFYSFVQNGNYTLRLEYNKDEPDLKEEEKSFCLSQQ
jgi:hypothetical protein